MLEIQKITRALGEARDTDVQIAFITKIIKKRQRAVEQKNPSTDYPVRVKGDVESILLLQLQKKRSKLQVAVIKDLEKLKTSGIIDEMKTFFISLAPAAGKKADVNIYQKERLPQNTVIATKKTLAGFDVEISIPLSYIELKNNTDWESFRVNFAFIDIDENNSRTTIWWQPEWDSETNFVGSGMFFKQP